MKECEKIQMLLLEHGETPEVRNHLAGCPECASFADFSSALDGLEEQVPPTPSLNSILERKSRAAIRYIASLATGVAAALICAVLALEFIPDSPLPAETRLAAQTAAANNSDTGLPTFSWDSSNLDNLQSEYEQLATVYDWNINEFDPLTTEVLK